MSTTAEKARTAPAATAQVSEKEACQVAEAARETEWSQPSFVRELFLGRLDLSLIYPGPKPDPEEQKRAAEFLGKVEALLKTVDTIKIEDDAKVPDSVIDGLR